MGKNLICRILIDYPARCAMKKLNFSIFFLFVRRSGIQRVWLCAWIWNRLHINEFFNLRNLKRLQILKALTPNKWQHQSNQANCSVKTLWLHIRWKVLLNQEPRQMKGNCLCDTKFWAGRQHLYERKSTISTRTTARQKVESLFFCNTKLFSCHRAGVGTKKFCLFFSVLGKSSLIRESQRQKPHRAKNVFYFFFLATDRGKKQAEQK